MVEVTLPVSTTEERAHDFVRELNDTLELPAQADAPRRELQYAVLHDGDLELHQSGNFIYV